LDIGLLSGFLELDEAEMSDNDIMSQFGMARRLMEQGAISLFTRQLALLGDTTSILARMVALSSLISRKSYSILALTALLPLAERVISFGTRILRRPAGRNPQC